MKSQHSLPQLRLLYSVFATLAFFTCLTIIVFSWPDHNDRKRAVFPHPARCCEIRIAHWVFVPSARAERERQQALASRSSGEAHSPANGISFASTQAQ